MKVKVLNNTKSRMGLCFYIHPIRVAQLVGSVVDAMRIKRDGRAEVMLRIVAPGTQLDGLKIPKRFTRSGVCPMCNGGGYCA